MNRIDASLYEVTAEFLELRRRLMDSTDDATTIEDTLLAESWPLEQKLIQCAFAARDLLAEAAKIKAEEERLAARRKRFETRAANLREHMYNSMVAADLRKVPHTLFDIAIKKNPAAVEIVDQALIPPTFLVMPPAPAPSVDKNAIKEALKAGVEVPGAKLTQSERLEVK